MQLDVFAFNRFRRRYYRRRKRHSENFAELKQSHTFEARLQRASANVH